MDSIGIPSANVKTPVVGIIMRRRERMDNSVGGVYDGFPAPSADDSMPTYSLAGDARKWRLPRADWTRHVDWMRQTYDVKHLALGIYDYLLSDEDLQEYVDWYMQPPYQRKPNPPILTKAKAIYAKARRAPNGIMFADWIQTESEA